MKNLLVYISPERSFSNKKFNMEFEKGWHVSETELLARVQIDNSLALGWKPRDILVITNFPYKYNGVKALVYDDKMYCDFAPTVSKMNAINNLIRNQIKDDWYWFHDWDAFQLDKIDAPNLKNDEIGMTDFGASTINPGRSRRFSTGTIFFRKEARDIFDEWTIETHKYKTNEETSLLEMLKKRRNKEMKKRVKKVNVTYNAATRRRDVRKVYEIAEKPVKVWHFHPFDKRPTSEGGNNMEVMVEGKNWLGKPLITDTLIEIFKEHKII